MIDSNKNEQLYYVNDMVKYIKADESNKDFTIHFGKIVKIVDDDEYIINFINNDESVTDHIKSKHVLEIVDEFNDKRYLYDLLMIEFISIVITYIYLYNFPFLLNLPILFSVFPSNTNIENMTYINTEL